MGLARTLDGRRDTQAVLLNQQEVHEEQNRRCGWKYGYVDTVKARECRTGDLFSAAEQPAQEPPNEG